LLIKKFEDGLNKEIKVKVLESRIDCDALEEEKANTRLAKIQELAIEAQRILKIVQKSTQQPSKIYPDQVQDQFSNSPKGYEAPSTTWATYGKPMDVDAVRFKPRFPQLTPEERDRHIKEGLCYRCHKSGHLSRDCPNGGGRGCGRGGFRGFRGRGGNMRARMQFSQEDFKDMLGTMSSEEKGQALMTIQEDFGIDP
jgi:hypothetical protein